VFVNTLFSCLATVSDRASFRPLWRPKFVSTLAPEDRCHLNGLAMDSARPAYVSAVSRSDVADGWRERRRDGGVIVDVARKATESSAYLFGLIAESKKVAYVSLVGILTDGRALASAYMNFSKNMRVPEGVRN